MIKAYICHEEWENISTVIFAECAGKARYRCMCTEALGDGLDFKDIYVRRIPELDKYYHGKEEMDWFNQEERAEGRPGQRP